MSILPTSSLKTRRFNTNQLHLRFLIFIFLFLSTFNLVAQNAEESYGFGRISLETGVFFPNHDNFKTTFNTNATINWRFGFDLGNENWRLYPFFKFSNFQFSDTITTITPTIINDSIQFEQKLTPLALKLNQISIGLAFPIKFKNDNEFIFRCAISENRHKINNEYLSDNRLGLFMSAGYRHRLDKNVDFTFDISHNYNKNALDTAFRDWSGFSLNMGLGINIL